MGGKTAFKPENKNVDSSSFEKLKLKLNEKARIVVLEDPHSDYAHDLKMPKILNGQPKMITKARKDGTEYQTYAEDFIAKYLCMGDEGILADKGSDPANCPMCAMAAESDRVEVPKRRFAVHVLKYNTKQNSTDITIPFGVKTVVWAFTDMIFNKLVDIAEEMGDLRKHDLLLGPCTLEDFQRYEIMPSMKAEWLMDAERTELCKTTFKENQAADLSVFCGRRSDKHRINEELNKIRDRWAIIDGEIERPVPGKLTSANDKQLLSAELDNLLEDDNPLPESTVVGAEVPVPAASDVTADKAEVSMPKPGSSGESMTTDDFDKLFENLDS